MQLHLSVPSLLSSQSSGDNCSQVWSDSSAEKMLVFAKLSVNVTLTLANATFLVEVDEESDGILMTSMLVYKEWRALVP